MIELLFAAPDLSQLRERLLATESEECAVLFTNAVSRNGAVKRLLVTGQDFPAEEDYSRQTGNQAQLRPAFVAKLVKTALRNDYGLVFVHTHPRGGSPEFSRVDDEGEGHLASFLARRGSNAVHGAMVLAETGCAARVLGTSEKLRVVEVGARRKIAYPAGEDSEMSPRFDRQVRALGVAGQQALQALRVGVVGLGGTGSVVVQQLAHLGVGHFTLVDPDVVEATNLNRLANAGPQDTGLYKTDVAARYIHAVAPSTHVVVIRDDVIRTRTASQLADVDILLCCTDSHGSRAVLQQLAYQYLIPCIDVGTVIAAHDGRVTHVYGRVQMLSPGQPCLTCSNLLDSNEVRRDMMTAFERQADPYLRGAREPAPAVMSLNSVVSSLAAGMVLGTATDAPFATGYLLFNAMAGTVRRAQSAAQPDCLICSKSGALARGDSWPLLGRQD
jgi:molybdopterin/thiamine biosynthesis adenylyltransferase